MKSHYKLAMSAGLLVVAVPITADAALLTNYDFTTAAKAFSSPQNGGVLSGSSVTFGGFNGANANQDNNRFIDAAADNVRVSFNQTGAASADGDTLAEGITQQNFITFTLTNNSGDDYDLTTWTYDIYYTSPAASGSPVYRTWGLTSRSGFTVGSELGVQTENGLGSSPDTPAEADAVSFDISSLGTLADSESIEFRLYFTDNRDSGSTQFRVDNVAVNGDLVPEPSSLALIGLGGLLIARRRRG